MARPHSNRPSKRNKPVAETTLRIVGGTFRGRKLKFAGDTRVRPMKDRVRESLFNLLGPAVKGTYAIDLFGGTGALALEAISRGAIGATVVERHIPTAKVIRDNISMLELDNRIELITADTFHWYGRRPSLPGEPWTVFCSPPYRVFTERKSDVLDLINDLLRRAPHGSLFAVEAAGDFDFDQLPHADQWDVRTYAPAVVGVVTVSDSVRCGAESGSQHHSK